MGFINQLITGGHHPVPTAKAFVVHKPLVHDITYILRTLGDVFTRVTNHLLSGMTLKLVPQQAKYKAGNRAEKR